MKKANVVLIMMTLLLSLVAFNPVTVTSADAPEVSTAIFSMDFVNDTLGYAVGHSGIILKTVDGGVNWQILNWSGSGNIRIMIKDVDFVSANEGWIVGENTTVNSYAFIMHTIDGGTSWEKQYYASEEINAIAMYNNTRGFAVGSTASGNGNFMILSYDNGTWSKEPMYQRSGILYDVFLVDSSKAFAVGTELSVWEYRPELPQGDEKWIFVLGFSSGIFRNCWFVNRTYGYAVSDVTQKIYWLNTKYGYYSRGVLSDIGSSINDIAFYNRTLGWIVSLNGDIWNTTDGGKTWNNEIEQNVYRAWRCIVVQHSSPMLWVGGGTEANGFGGTAELTTIGYKGSPWAIQLSPSMDFNINYNNQTYKIHMEADSTLTNFQYLISGKTIYFKVFGPKGMIGHCNITVPKAIIETGLQVKVDGMTILDAVITQNATHYFVYITYKHSIHNVEVKTNWLVGDFDGDNDVDIFDIVAIAGAYSSVEGDENYHSIYDVAEPYKQIDIFDVVTVVAHYGEKL